MKVRPIFSILGIVLILTTKIWSQEINLSHVGNFGGDVNSMAIHGQYAYISQGIDFVVLDMADPRHPQPIGRLAMGAMAADIVYRDGYAYVRSTQGNGFLVVDVSTPTSPSLAGACTANSANWGNLAVNGHYAYMTDQ
jgi:hypothetical protein